MGLQARMSEHDDRLYSPARDVAHCFADVMREAAARLEDERWAALAALLKKEGVTQEELGAACQAACLFVASAVDSPKEKMGECLARCGFWKVPEAANIGLMAIVGTVMMGYFWGGAHEATMGGKGPCLKAQDLRALGAQCHEAMTAPRWRRWLWALRRFW